MKLGFVVGANGLIPDGDETGEWFRKRKPGQLVFGDMVVPRNGKFHRKFFAMLNVCYANWDKPVIKTPYGDAICTAKTFRNDVICLAGYGEPVANSKGEWRIKAKSIAFANMDDDEFGKLYSAVVNVILERFLPKWSVADVDRAADSFILGFA
jgi:hypothetical protein